MRVPSVIVDTTFHTMDMAAPQTLPEVIDPAVADREARLIAIAARGRPVGYFPGAAVGALGRKVLAEFQKALLAGKTELKIER